MVDFGDELRKLMTGGPSKEEAEMQAAASDARLRGWVQNMSDGDLEDALWIVGALSSEGKGNYRTFLILGALMAERWHRHPLVPEDAARFGGEDVGEDGEGLRPAGGA